LEGIHTTKKVYLNTGSSWVRSYKHQIYIGNAKNNHKNIGTRFVDLNGDGLVDVITSRTVTRIQINCFTIAFAVQHINKSITVDI
jgi:hypothetical protein